MPLTYGAASIASTISPRFAANGTSGQHTRRVRILCCTRPVAKRLAELVRSTPTSPCTIKTMSHASL
jgi:hypothetical protein